MLARLGNMRLDSKSQLPIKAVNENQLTFNVSLTLGEITYDVPKTRYERSFSDCIWFCPRLFQALSADLFTRLLSAVLLE